MSESINVDDIFYKEERYQTQIRLIVLACVYVVYVVLMKTYETSMTEELFTISLWLSIIIVWMIIHYIFIMMYPKAILGLRKNLVITGDLVGITYLIDLLQENGIFLFPLYLWIIMGNGLRFGFSHLYWAMGLSAFSWLYLVIYSSYWGNHYDVLATFAVTSLVVPMFYFKFITRLHEKNEELNELLFYTEHQANNDVLTRIPNRQSYEFAMKKYMKAKEPFALLFLDLNEFKSINDTYGHHMGDLFLKELASRLKKSITDSDFVARLGGDEFVVVKRGTHRYIESYIEDMYKEVTKDFVAQGRVFKMQVSIGASLFPSDSKERINLNKFADQAMYAAKNSPDRYYMFYQSLKSTEEPCFQI